MLAAVTTYFNPAHSNRILLNYLRFAEYMYQQGVDLWTVEIAFGSDEFMIPKHERCMRIRTPDIMWQRERAVNALIETLPNIYDNVVLIDADIFFEDSNWADNVVHKLEECSVIQCFSEMKELYPSGKLCTIRRMSVIKAHQIGISKASAPITGRVWAARRSFLEKHPPYDAHIAGHGDVFMAATLVHWLDHPHITQYTPPKLLKHFLRWAYSVQSDPSVTVGYLEQTIVHLWHGSKESRQYLERLQPLIDYDFDPENDICIGPDKLWHWSSDKPELHREVGSYFHKVKDYDAKRHLPQPTAP